jgi:hypothetical protein
VVTKERKKIRRDNFAWGFRGQGLGWDPPGILCCQRSPQGPLLAPDHATEAATEEHVRPPVLLLLLLLLLALALILRRALAAAVVGLVPAPLLPLLPLLLPALRLLRSCRFSRSSSLQCSRHRGRWCQGRSSHRRTSCEGKQGKGMRCREERTARRRLPTASLPRRRRGGEALVLEASRRPVPSVEL